MRGVKFLLFSAVVSAVGLQAQQKAFDWIPQNTSSYRIGPGYHSGVAVYSPHGWEAVHVRVDIDARQPVTVGVVRLEDWTKAVHNPRQLSRLDYACLTEEVTHISYSCNFYPADIARVVVVRDARPTERNIITGAAQSSFVQNGVSAASVNDVRVTPYYWECVDHCNQPDPPQFAWVDLRKEAFEITRELKSYGPFTPEQEESELRIRIKAQTPMTVAVLPSSVADKLLANDQQAQEALSSSKCKQYGVQSSTLECSLQKGGGPMQVVVLPEAEIRKKKKAEITISSEQCVANCEK